MYEINFRLQFCSGYTVGVLGGITFRVLGFCAPLKSTILWVVKSCSVVEVHLRFGGTYRLHLQGRIVSQVRNQQEADGWQIELRLQNEADIGQKVTGRELLVA
jgi:hypothetical protein